MTKISVSLLSVRDKLKEKTMEMDKLNIDYIHIDVMDGKFVTNTAFTIEEALLVREYTNKPFDIHLMVENIDEYVDMYSILKPEYITFHYEAMKDINIIKKIKDMGIKCGISIKPNTKVRKIYNLLPYIDLVLVMSVEPGMGGQKFIPNSLRKIRKLRKKIDSKKLNVLISVDGGINNSSATKCIESGVDILAIGSALTNSEKGEELVDFIKM